MPGARSQSKWARYVGILAAAIGLIGYTVFGWRFGENDGSVPFILGLLVAFVAVAWTLYQGLNSSSGDVEVQFTIEGILIAVTPKRVDG